MGLKVALVALALALTPAGYLEGRQLPSGGFAEPGRQTSPQLTAWVVLGLRASGRPPNAAALTYLVAHEDALVTATDLALGALGELAAGGDARSLLARLEAFEREDGRIGPALNSTFWGAIAMRAAGRPVPRATVRYVLAHQARSGGWAWAPGLAPDSNDTAAAIEALRACGVRGRPIARGLRYLRRLQNRDGGFELIEGRGSDTPSTAWAIQAFLAAGADPGKAAYVYLRRMQRPDGSLRYSARYVTNPVWVTAQALPALARKQFPLPSATAPRRRAMRV
jgi:hypothetical protein